MRELFLLTEVSLHYEQGQPPHPYIVRSGFGAAARRLFKKDLLREHPDSNSGLVLVSSLTDKGEYLLQLIQGLIRAA